jgi:predicted dienelactone hydrolase
MATRRRAARWDAAVWAGVLLGVWACGGDGARGADGGDDGLQTEALASDAASDLDAAPPWPPDQPGPYRAAARSVTFHDPDRQRDLPGFVWYPTTAETGEAFEYMGLKGFGAALKDAPVADAAPFPVVVFSHGHAAFAVESLFLMEHLASHGYVSAACEHVGNTFGTYQAEKLVKGLEDRPLDVSLVLDTMLSWNDDDASPLHGRLDPDRVGMAGHSMGAYTTFVMMGPEVSIQRFVDACNEPQAASREGQWFLCDDLLASAAVTPPTCAPCQPGDDRFKAFLSMTPGFSEAFLPGELAALAQPVLIMGGDLDDITPLEASVRPFFDQATHPDTLLWTLARAAHNSFSNACDLFHAASMGCGPTYIDPERGHLLIRTAAAAWFGVHLKGDARYGAWFEPAYLAANPEIALERKAAPTSP